MAGDRTGRESRAQQTEAARPQAAHTDVLSDINDITASGIGAIHSTDLSASPAVDLAANAAPAPDWTRLWAFPLCGAAYLAHLRFRRYSPRRLPTLTSIKPFEIYATATAYLTFATEVIHLSKEALRDRDLYTIHVALLAFGLHLAPAMEKARQQEIFKSTQTFEELAPKPEEGVLARLAWRYHTARSDVVAFNVATVGLIRTMGAESYIRKDKARLDADFRAFVVLMTNYITAIDKGAHDTSTMLTETKCAIGFGLLTPFAMLARRSALRPFKLLSFPMNLAQRALVVGMLNIPQTTAFHDNANMISTMRDKHAVAELCRALIPDLVPTVDDMMKRQVDVLGIFS